MKKNYIKKILLIIVILSFTLFITYIGTKSSYAQEIIDKSYHMYIGILLVYIIILYCIKVLPHNLRKRKLKKIITKEDYNTLKDFLELEEPEDEELEFLTFTEVSSTVINIILLHKRNLNYENSIEFTQEEKSNISKYRNQDDISSKYIVDYYEKCEEIIAIINKYYDSKGKLKKN